MVLCHWSTWDDVIPNTPGFVVQCQEVQHVSLLTINIHCMAEVVLDISVMHQYDMRIGTKRGADE